MKGWVYATFLTDALPYFADTPQLAVTSWQTVSNPVVLEKGNSTIHYRRYFEALIEI